MLVSKVLTFLIYHYRTPCWLFYGSDYTDCWDLSNTRIHSHTHTYTNRLAYVWKWKFNNNRKVNKIQKKKNCFGSVRCGWYFVVQFHPNENIRIFIQLPSHSYYYYLTLVKNIPNLNEKCLSYSNRLKQ